MAERISSACRFYGDGCGRECHGFNSTNRVGPRMEAESRTCAPARDDHAWSVNGKAGAASPFPSIAYHAAPCHSAQGATAPATEVIRIAQATPVLTGGQDLEAHLHGKSGPRSRCARRTTPSRPIYAAAAAATSTPMGSESWGLLLQTSEQRKGTITDTAETGSGASGPIENNENNPPSCAGALSPGMLIASPHGSSRFGGSRCG